MASRATVMAATVLLLVACTGAPPATPSPQPTPTLPPPFTPAPPPTPTAAPQTPAPTPPATPSPTEAPTAAPTPTAEPTATAGGETFVELFTDDMSDPTSGWGTGQTAGGTVSYADETLDLTPSQAGAYIWSRREVEGNWQAMRVSGTLLPAPESSGYLGFLCGEADNDLLGAVVSTDGGWIFARIRDGVAQALGSDLDAGLNIGLAEPIAFMLDCVVQPGGTLDMELYVNGQSVGSQSADDGPPGLNRVAAYAEADEGPFTARFDDVRLIASSDPNGLPEPMSNAALDLLQHVPEAYRPLCFESAVSGAEPGALAAITCGLPEDNPVDLAEYVQFDSPDTMNAAYQQRVATYGDGGDGGCDEGPAEGPYTIAGQDTGRLLCAEQIVGARYDWTDNRLDILSNLTDFDADYGALYAVWLEAGPDL